MRVSLNSSSPLPSPAYAYTGGKPFSIAPGADQPTVIFLHGAQNDHSVWILQSRYLAHHGYGVLALDLPGHGRSAGPALTSVPDMARWVRGVIDTLGLKRCALVGHSMGSLIAVQCAIDQGSSGPIAALACVGSAYPMRVSEALLEATRQDEPRAISMINQWSFSRLNQRPGLPGPGFSVYVQSRRLMERQPKGVLAIDFAACNSYEIAPQALADIQLPVQFISGRNDVMTSLKAAQGFAAQIPGAALAVIESCGHQLMGEQPDAVLAHLKAFLAARLPLPVGA
jgi:pimeloyl-ACP methyl ester carboxylesterase